MATGGLMPGPDHRAGHAGRGGRRAASAAAWIAWRSKATAFHARVREGFLAEAARRPTEIVVVDAARSDRASAGRDSEHAAQIVSRQVSESWPSQWTVNHGREHSHDLARHRRTRRRGRAVSPGARPRAAGQQLSVCRAGGHRQTDLRPETGPGPALPDAAGRGAGPVRRRAHACTHGRWPARIPTSTWSPSPTTSRSFRWNCSSATGNIAARGGLCHDIGMKPSWAGGRSP